MLTKEQLTTLKDSLPYDGTKRIKAKLHRVSKRVIAVELNNPNTSRLDIVNAAIEVVQEHREQVSKISNTINEFN